MEKLRRVVNEIAYTHSPSKLSPLQRSLIPLLSFASSLYKFALSLRRSLYHLGFFATHRLPVPVISVGNLTWGGNGKTPMVEFIALWLADSGISPLILSRGYQGGDEVNMLKRHLSGTSAKFGVGANRVAVAGDFIQRYGYVDSRKNSWIEKPFLDGKVQIHFDSEKIGAVVLDDAMQVLEHILNDIESIIRGIKESVPIFFTRMDPSYLFEVGIINSKMPLRALHKAVVLCVSAIGSADSFVQGIQKMETFFVDRLDFSDHHRFHSRDIEIIRGRLGELADKFDSKPFVVVTEKDYDRDPEILKQLSPFKVFVLYSKLRVMSDRGSTEDEFKGLLKDQLELKLPGANQY